MSFRITINTTIVLELQSWKGLNTSPSSTLVKEAQRGIELPTSCSIARDLNHWATQQFLLIQLLPIAL